LGQSLCPQPQQGEELRQVDQPFRFLAFLGGERLSGILPVEEGLQASGDRFRQSEPGQVGGEIEFKGQGHGNLRKLRLLRAGDTSGVPSALLGTGPKLLLILDHPIDQPRLRPFAEIRAEERILLEARPNPKWLIRSWFLVKELEELFGF